MASFFIVFLSLASDNSDSCILSCSCEIIMSTLLLVFSYVKSVQTFRWCSTGYLWPTVAGFFYRGFFACPHFLQRGLFYVSSLRLVELCKKCLFLPLYFPPFGAFIRLECYCDPSSMRTIFCRIFSVIVISFSQKSSCMRSFRSAVILLALSKLLLN